MSGKPSLSAAEAAEFIAGFLSDTMEGDDRVQGIFGPTDDIRVLIVLQGGDLLTVDVQRAEVRPL